MRIGGGPNRTVRPKLEMKAMTMLGDIALGTGQVGRSVVPVEHGRIHRAEDVARDRSTERARTKLETS